MKKFFILLFLFTSLPLKANTLTFLAVGDIMLSRGVTTCINSAKNPFLPFEDIQNLLNSTDFNFGNLESPITENSFDPTHHLVFSVQPQNAIGLKKYHFEILNLANNHAMDQGKTGLDNTIKFLDDNHIQHVGTGDNLKEAWEGKILTVHGIKVGFIGASFTSINDKGVSRNNYVARIQDLKQLRTSIDQLKPFTDFIIVTMHAGVEYTSTPNTEQITFAHAAIDDGADMVIGTHPHWIQTTEKYCPKNKPCSNPKEIFYSLGNFIFDQNWSQKTKEGLVLKITLTHNASEKLVQIEPIPIIIENACSPKVSNTNH